MENENSKSSSSSKEDSEYSDIDSDRPNLLQINKKIDKINLFNENLKEYLQKTEQDIAKKGT